MATIARTILVILLALGHAAGAPVDCSNADNLCTGDPCVIPVLEPEAPCIVDFGTRAVVIQGLQNVQGVQFTAGSFAIQGTVSGGVGGGGFFHLVTAPLFGGIAINGLITLSGVQNSGLAGSSTVELRTEGGIGINAPIRVMSGGAGDELLLEAGTSGIYGTAPILNAEGAGAVTLRSQGVVELRGSIRSRLQGGLPGLSAPLTIEAGQKVELFERTSVADGEVTVTSGSNISVYEPIRTRGPAVTLDAQNGLELLASIKSVGTGSISSSCDGITILGGGGTIISDDRIQCTGVTSSNGVIVAADGAVTLESVASASRGTAGDVTITSNAGTVVLSGLLDAHGGVAGGDVQISGTGVQIDVPRVDTRFTGTAGTAGTQRYTAVSGDLSLSRAFLAQDGGTIEASASGNLTADGNFRVGPGGCIALSAGGTLDTGSSSFDQPVVADCP